jgi:hypothetical protein
MPLYALRDGNRVRALKDGPRRAGCAECGQEMIARTGAVVIWHWAHRVHNPQCETAPESEWHLGWKALAIDGTQEVRVGRRRADVLAPGGFAVEFQASALDREEVRAREDDWAAQGGMAWVFKAEAEFADGRIWVLPSIRGRQSELAKPENRATLDVTWSHAPERVRAARAPSFLDLGNDELLFIGGWRQGLSPLTGYGWRVSRDWVVQNLLRGSEIPAALAADPEEIRRAIEKWEQAAEQAARAQRRKLAAAQQKRVPRVVLLSPAERYRREVQAKEQRKQALQPEPGFVINEGLRAWRLAWEASRMQEAEREASRAAEAQPEDGCPACIQMRRNGRDPRQAWPDYARHVRESHTVP